MSLLERDLTSQGYQVVVLRDQNMGLVEPSDFDYKRVQTDADAILHVWITEVGVSSPATKLSYRPQMNVKAQLISAKDYRELFYESIDYGADVTVARNGNIPSAPQFSWGTFATLMEKLLDVAEGLKAGTQLVSEHIATPIRKEGV